MEKLPANQQDVTAQFAREACRGSAGLPVGVQVIALALESYVSAAANAYAALKEVRQLVMNPLGSLCPWELVAT